MFVVYYPVKDKVLIVYGPTTEYGFINEEAADGLAIKKARVKLHHSPGMLYQLQVNGKWQEGGSNFIIILLPTGPIHLLMLFHNNVPPQPATITHKEFHKHSTAITKNYQQKT
jgi:hypothetical protein